MDKQKIFWGLAVGAFAFAAGFCAFCTAPKEPVVMTYQTSSVEKQTTVQGVTEPVTKPAQTQSARTTAVTAASTVTAVTEAQAPERNLNLASEADLQRVSGIGAALAAAIVAYRSELGGFTYRAQLLEISGIGETLLERIMAEFEIPDEQPPPDEPATPAPQDVPEVSDVPAEPEILRYNANTVTREELLTLPDMTEARADAILDMRSRLGAYHGIYEIVLADGISGEYFERVLRVYLYVEGDPYSDIPT